MSTRKADNGNMEYRYLLNGQRYFLKVVFNFPQKQSLLKYHLHLLQINMEEMCDLQHTNNVKEDNIFNMFN